MIAGRSRAAHGHPDCEHGETHGKRIKKAIAERFRLFLTLTERVVFAKI